MIIISNGKLCPCPKINCPNHGDCEACQHYHEKSNGLPFCKSNHGFFTKIFYRRQYKMVQQLKMEGML